MNTDARNNFIVVGAVLLIIAIGWFVFSDGAKFGCTSGIRFLGAANVAESDYVVPPMERDYKNERFRFSLKLPQGFTAAELPFDGDGTPIVLQDVAGNGIQIYVREAEGNPRNLTEGQIRASIPDMQVSGAQVVEIGENNKGVAFMSDSPEFGGASREVWFYFGGNLYQVSTYARLDNLLQAMFGSWQFY